MPLDFYWMPASSPCRSALLTAKAVGVELNLKEINLMAGEQMKPEFVAINPQHCVPTLVDDDFVLWESRAICSYLASQYGKDDSLYPNDPKARAKVDRMLYFDVTLYDRFGLYVYPFIFGGQELDPKRLEKFVEGMGWLDGYLAGQKWAAADTITIADHTLAASVSTFIATGIVDFSKYSNVSAWLARCEAEMPGYAEVNTPGANAFGGMFKDKQA